MSKTWTVNCDSYFYCYKKILKEQYFCTRFYQSLDNKKFTSLIALQSLGLSVARSVTSDHQQVHSRNDHSWKRQSQQNNEWWRLVLPNQSIGKIHVQSPLPSILCYCYSCLYWSTVHQDPVSPCLCLSKWFLHRLFARIQFITLDIQSRGVLDLGAHLYYMYILGGKTWYCSTSSLGAFTMELGGAGNIILFSPLKKKKWVQTSLWKSLFASGLIVVSNFLL